VASDKQHIRIFSLVPGRKERRNDLSRSWRSDSCDLQKLIKEISGVLTALKARERQPQNFKDEEPRHLLASGGQCKRERNSLCGAMNWSEKDRLYRQKSFNVHKQSKKLTCMPDNRIIKETTIDEPQINLSEQDVDLSLGIQRIRRKKKDLSRNTL
jgi:hypothetical protein